MKRKSIISHTVFAVIIALPLLVSAENSGPVSAGDDDPYGQIVYLYQKLSTGFAGSRGFHVFQMRQYLDRLTGHRIRTDYDFSVVIDHQKPILQTAFPEKKWIAVHCEGLSEALVELGKEGKLPDMQSWWRRGMLFAVDGKLIYYVIRSDSEVVLHLYFRDVKLLRLGK